MQERRSLPAIALYEKAITNHTDRGDVIYEPFSGSGTCIAAAERLRRSCHAMEIDPKYVDVAVIRWQNFTGRKAIHEETGATFEHVKAGRRLEAEDAIKEEVMETPEGGS